MLIVAALMTKDCNGIPMADETESIDERSRIPWVMALKCKNCGHPVQRAIEAWVYGCGPVPKHDQWTHGIGRQSNQWVGIRCPRRSTGATPPDNYDPREAY